MANPYAGEVALVIDGERRILKLTLGALAELETALEADSLVVAGLRGGGADVQAADLLRAEIAGGPVQAARAAAELLARAFMVPR